MDRAEQAVRKVITGNNFMTPNILGYGSSGKFHYELSTGRFMSDTLYGVTVVEDCGYTVIKRNDLSRCCHSHQEAQRYIDSLKDVS